jgi:hypothetical protein
MNVQQAKSIPLREILSRLGKEPTKQLRGDLWYCSPFRSEKVPSFKVNPERNIWYDFGEGKGGNVLDFAMRYFNVSSIPDALRELEALNPGGLPFSRSVPQPAPRKAPEPATLTPDATVKPLENRALLTYLANRGIAAELARSFLDEIHYTRDGKAYFAVAFKNNSGGFELRNPYFKGTNGPKDITTMTSLEPTAPMAVFEGGIDLLSAIACGVLTKPLPPILVLNSNALRDKAIAAIQESKPAAVDLYLDNDTSGRDLAEYFRQQLTAAGIQVNDRSDLYGAHKDFNDYLTSQQKRAVGR